MAQRLMTPGVYIEEVNAFPGSVVEVATAIPAFIGYTEKASRNGKDLVNQPTRITSIAEFHHLFGGAFFPRFTLNQLVEGDLNKHKIKINGTDKAINFEQDNLMYMLYRGLQLFFSNGGGACYIVSVGIYEGVKLVDIQKGKLEGGLIPLLKEQEPTMIIIPDAVKLSDDDCYDLYKKVLAHCAKMQSRIAILDVFRGDEVRIVNFTDPKVDIITNFRESIGSEYLNYAAAYYPWLNTNVIQKTEITFENLITPLGTLLPPTETVALSLVNDFPTDDAGFLMNLKKDKADDFNKALEIDTEKALKLNPQFKFPTEPGEVKKPTVVAQPKAVTEPKPAVAAPPALATPSTDQDRAKFEEATKKFEEYEVKRKAFEEFGKATKARSEYLDNYEKYEAYLISLKKYFSSLHDSLVKNKLTQVKSLLPDYIKNKNRNYHLGLIATSPTYTQILDEIREFANILPPSAAMAGIYTMVDNNRGVWKSPANISLNSVLKPTANITHDEQENLNVDAISGKSINAIRTFPGIGTLVWGGRTLDGNSLDWKYINVRRTMIMLEQSIKMALRSYVFEPNDANTWVSVKSMIVNYLTEKWKQGALAGASPDDAFEVQVGLGLTMTGLDILEGKMLVSVKLAIVRPAEFIVVTFEQQMQKS